MLRRLGPFVALLCALLALAGCGERRSQPAPAADAPGAALIATSGYGSTTLLETRVAPGPSLMRALRGATPVETAYGGGFVNSMLGLASDTSGPRDWLFFVNGVSSDVGARSVPVTDGDAIWWDYRAWGGMPVIPAVVGQWPAPFALPGGRGPEVEADPELRDLLSGAGARLAAGASPWRARVGASDALAAREPAWRRALADPDAAGLSVRIDDGVVTALATDGRERIAVPGARALIAAVPTETSAADGVLLAVVGIDAAAARAAAAALTADPGILRLRYAVALDAAGVPLVAGGQATP